MPRPDPELQQSTDLVLQLLDMIQDRIAKDGSTEKTPYGSPFFAEIRKLADDVIDGFDRYDKNMSGCN